MKRARAPLLVVLATAAGAFPQSGGSAPVQDSQCALENVKLEVGMPRLEAETRIAVALGKQNEYSLYANNLLGGSVEYRDIACTLKVSFRPGAPAALLKTTEGDVVHRLPIDESVGEFKLEFVRSPDREPAIPSVDAIASCAVHGHDHAATGRARSMAHPARRSWKADVRRRERAFSCALL